MVIETPIALLAGASASFLLGRLEGVAESKDHKKKIRNALNTSIQEAYIAFQSKYPEFSESFFDQEFLENHVLLEVSKFLTRSERPNANNVAKEFPNYVVMADENEYESEIEKFFEFVLESMKKHAVLSDIINSRQIEETSQDVKQLRKGQERLSANIEEGLSSIGLAQLATHGKLEGLHELFESGFGQLMNVMGSNKLPSSSGSELSELITKQLDRAKTLINSGATTDSKELLLSIEEEVAGLDEHTRFRWHTNIAACFLANDNQEEAARHYLIAYKLAPEDEKAIANRIRAFLLKGDFEGGVAASIEAIGQKPGNGLIFSLYINARILNGEEVSDEDVPLGLRGDSLVLLSLSEINLRQNKFKQAYRLARESYDTGDLPNDSRRVVLVAALMWVNSDPVKAQYCQLDSETRESLEYAFGLFENKVDILGSIQSRSVFVELSHNLLVAADILGEEEEGNRIKDYVLSVYPNDPDLLWIKISHLRRLGAYDDIKSLTDDCLEKLDKKLLFVLGEISANSGDVEWFKIIQTALEKKLEEDRDAIELFGLELCSIWKSGDKGKAITIAEMQKERVYSIPSLLTFYIRMVDDLGRIGELKELVEKCKEFGDDVSSVDTLNLADFFYDYGEHYESSKWYRKLIEEPSGDYLTRRYLSSLIHSNQRGLAEELLNSLPIEIRNTSFFRRCELNLARASGDLARLEQLIELELKDYPNESGLASGYAATLYRRGKRGELIHFLKSLDRFDPVVPENEIEIAKYQMNVGLVDDALARV